MRIVATSSLRALSIFLLSVSSGAWAQSIPVIDNAENPQLLAYDVVSNHKSSNCELYINGFGDGTETSYHAIGGSLYEAWLQVNGLEQVERLGNKVLNAGGYFRYSEQTTEIPEPAVKETLVLGAPQSDDPYYYRIDFRYKWHNMDKEISRTVHNFAFFVDIQRRDAKTQRLWLTNGNRDFTMAEVFDHHPLTSWISVGPGLRSMRYLQGYSGSPIFGARRSCNR